MAEFLGHDSASVISQMRFLYLFNLFIEMNLGGITAKLVLLGTGFLYAINIERNMDRRRI